MYNIHIWYTFYIYKLHMCFYRNSFKDAPSAAFSSTPCTIVFNVTFWDLLWLKMVGDVSSVGWGFNWGYLHMVEGTLDSTDAKQCALGFACGAVAPLLSSSATLNSVGNGACLVGGSEAFQQGEGGKQVSWPAKSYLLLSLMQPDGIRM